VFLAQKILKLTGSLGWALVGSKMKEVNEYDGKFYIDEENIYF
jgi:hypothetical protein